MPFKQLQLRILGGLRQLVVAKTRRTLSFWSRTLLSKAPFARATVLCIGFNVEPHASSPATLTAIPIFFLPNELAGLSSPVYPTFDPLHYGVCFSCTTADAASGVASSPSQTWNACLRRVGWYSRARASLPTVCPLSQQRVPSTEILLLRTAHRGRALHPQLLRVPRRPSAHKFDITYLLGPPRSRMESSTTGVAGVEEAYKSHCAQPVTVGMGTGAGAGMRLPPGRVQVVFVARHVDLHCIPAPLLAVQPAQTVSTQPSSTLPTVLLVPPPPTPTPTLPVRVLEAQEDLVVFFAAVSSAPASSVSPTCWRTVYGAISPSLGASWRIRCCTTSHVISIEEQGVQTHPNTLYTTAYETYSKELKNSVPKPKCIPSTQVICQCLIEILADTTP
ncbi:hypothetical protein DFH08DRAFT_817834 [Mycena albidolilacea]|uniref:Uncharacterized protein n=1 Tax=Mycena albidolilacea TaxID=1033008 RepID=A0AAD6ZHZ6_9AGAR|nr:hypothetical protein DFH08DRAFT_817834 [Mycena albidolilacea]